MKVPVVAFATLLLLTSPAMANQCPLLINQLNEAVGNMKPDDPAAKKGKELIAQAQKAHDEGKHAESVAKADEAAKVLGVKLAKKM